MVEENLITCAKIVKSWFAIGCLEEAQTGTFSVTGFEPRAFAALAGESLLLQSAEAVLLGAIEHLRQAIRAYVT